jgi:hypothetical protein
MFLIDESFRKKMSVLVRFGDTPRNGGVTPVWWKKFKEVGGTKFTFFMVNSVFTTHFDRGDFRIIDGEKIQPRVRRPPVVSG